MYCFDKMTVNRFYDAVLTICILRPFAKSAYQKNIFLFLKQNICCGYSKEPSQWDSSFEHQKQYDKTDGQENIYNFHRNLCILETPK